jgi:CHASE1-domain containing sensor protein
MSREIALTILIPLLIVSLPFFAMSVVTKFKQRRKRRTMERGITDLVHQVRTRRSNAEESRSTRTRLRADRGNRRKRIRLEKRPQV